MSSILADHIMPKGHSPSHFNGEADNFYDPNFTLDISKRMRVPKNIRISGDFTDEDVIGTNGTNWNQMNHEKYDMNVPDRILVVGQEQHMGTKAMPREIAIDNSVLPKSEPGLVRVQTPPRVLKLDEHYFPAVDEDERNSFANNNSEDKVPLKPQNHFAETQIARHVRESTPSFGALDVSLAPSEEIQHLRRQVGKLNRRVIAVEQEVSQRQKRDKLFYAVTIAYIILKAFSWLSRN